MDGNGRWARRNGLPRQEGHRAGARAVRATVSECRKIGIPFLTLYAFSSENWRRPASEIAALFSLLLEFLGVETPLLAEQGIALNVIGNLDGLPTPQIMALKHSMAKTAGGKDMRLNLALNYGARAEIVKAARELAAANLAPDKITEETFASHLYTAGQPDPDLLIRTSGEMRLSNYLLYQCAYSELYFTPVLWPDFDARELHKAICAYACRQRRFGMTSEQSAMGESSFHGS